MKKMFITGWRATCLAILLLNGAGMTKAEDMSKWIAEDDGFKATALCETSDFQIVSPPYSTANVISDGGTCGKVYIFTDSDSDDRIAFAGGLVFDPVIDVEKYESARRQLIEMLAKAGGAADLRLDFSDVGAGDINDFEFKQIATRSNGVQGPAGSMTWDVGIRAFGRHTLMVFSGVTDLAKQQDTLTQEEKNSMDELLAELSRWKLESLNLLVKSAQNP